MDTCGTVYCAGPLDLSICTLPPKHAGRCEDDREQIARLTRERDAARMAVFPATLAEIESWLKSTPTGRILWAKWARYEATVDERDAARAEVERLTGRLAMAEVFRIGERVIEHVRGLGWGVIDREFNMLTDDGAWVYEGDHYFPTADAAFAALDAAGGCASTGAVAGAGGGAGGQG